MFKKQILMTTCLLFSISHQNFAALKIITTFCNNEVTEEKVFTPQQALKCLKEDIEANPTNLINYKEYIRLLEELCHPIPLPYTVEHLTIFEADSPWLYEGIAQIDAENYVAARYCLQKHLIDKPNDLIAHCYMVIALENMLPEKYREEERKGKKRKAATMEGDKVWETHYTISIIQQDPPSSKSTSDSVLEEGDISEK